MNPIREAEQQRLRDLLEYSWSDTLGAELGMAMIEQLLKEYTCLLLHAPVLLLQHRRSNLEELQVVQLKSRHACEEVLKRGLLEQELVSELPIPLLKKLHQEVHEGGIVRITLAHPLNEPHDVIGLDDLRACALIGDELLHPPQDIGDVRVRIRNGIHLQELHDPLHQATGFVL